MDQPIHGGMHGGLELHIVVAERIHGNSAYEIEVGFPLRVVEMHAAAAHEFHRRALVGAEYGALEGRRQSGAGRLRFQHSGVIHRLQCWCRHAHTLPTRVNTVPRSSCSIAAMSEILTRFTPPSSATIAACSFAAIPPCAVPSSMRRCASSGASETMDVPSFRTPATSDTSRSSSASIATAMVAAASSLFTLSVSPSDGSVHRLTGERTGRYPPASRCISSPTFTCEGTPTNPYCSGSSGVADSNPASSPDSPTAGTFTATSALTSRLFAEPESAMRMISRSSTLVTRRPPLNSETAPYRRCSVDTSSPPPCTTTSDPGAARCTAASAPVSNGSSCGRPVSYTHLRAHETGRNLVC